MSLSLSKCVPLPSSAPVCHRELPAASFRACKASGAARADPLCCPDAGGRKENLPGGRDQPQLRAGASQRAWSNSARP